MQATFAHSKRSKQ